MALNQNLFAPLLGLANCILLLFSLVLATGGMAAATPSGLNNIPTADVTPSGLLVLQQFTNFGPGQETLFHLGFKYGAAANWEIGLDDRLARTGSGAGVAGAGGMPAGPPVLQIKYAANISLFPKTCLAAGVANIGADTDRAGYPFSYLVVSRQLGSLRAHLGHSWQRHNPAGFIGVDRPVNRKLTLRTDWIQANDRDDSVSSLGFIQDLGKGWLLEAWGSFPTTPGLKDTITVKLNYLIRRLGSENGRR